MKHLILSHYTTLSGEWQVLLVNSQTAWGLLSLAASGIVLHA